jgi:hypothetical protein
MDTPGQVKSPGSHGYSCLDWCKIPSCHMDTVVSSKQRFRIKYDICIEFRLASSTEATVLMHSKVPSGICKFPVTFSMKFRWENLVKHVTLCKFQINTINEKLSTTLCRSEFLYTQQSYVNVPD